MIVKIEVGTRLQDNGDGGYTMYVYPSYEAAKEGVRQCILDSIYDEDDCENEMKELKDFDEGKHHDEYEYGYLGTDTIEVEISCGGELDDVEFEHLIKDVKLAKVCSFHGGQ